MISKNAIVSGTGCRAVEADKWVDPINKACSKYGITGKKSIAAFLANIGVETGDLTRFTENLNYSAQGLANTWPTRYAVDSKAKVKVPNELAYKLNRNPQAIANNAYANRMGNGPESSGDGWRYRGQGAKQITGKANFEAYAKSSGIDAVNHPELLSSDPETIIDSAAWFFAKQGNCIPAAEADDFDLVVFRINGARPNDANKGWLRKQRYKDCLRFL